MSSPLDRIEADRLRDQLRDALNGRFVGGDIAWNLLSTWDALVNVAKAAEEAARLSRPTEAQMHALREALAMLDKADNK